VSHPHLKRDGKTCYDKMHMYFMIRWNHIFKYV